MEITKKSFSDGFSWVLSSLKLCLPKAPAFIAMSVLASIVFTVLVLVLGLVGGLLAKIPVLGIIIAIAVAIVVFVLSLGFYCGFIRAIQTMIDNGKVTFGSFFFALKDKKFLIKIAPFAIILGIAIFGTIAFFGYILYLTLSSGITVLAYILAIIGLLVLVMLYIYGTYALILFVQRNDPKIFATFSDTAKGLSNNILPIVGMYLGLVAVSIIVSVICNIFVSIIQANPSSIVLALVLLLIILVLQCIYAMLSLTSICVSAKEIFVENDVEEAVETEENTDSENQQ